MYYINYIFKQLVSINYIFEEFHLNYYYYGILFTTTVINLPKKIYKFLYQQVCAKISNLDDVSSIELSANIQFEYRM